jgi:hypothetical protein
MPAWPRRLRTVRSIRTMRQNPECRRYLSPPRSVVMRRIARGINVQLKIASGLYVVADDFFGTCLRAENSTHGFQRGNFAVQSALRTSPNCSHEVPLQRCSCVYAGHRSERAAHDAERALLLLGREPPHLGGAIRLGHVVAQRPRRNAAAKSPTCCGAMCGRKFIEQRVTDSERPLFVTRRSERKRGPPQAHALRASKSEVATLSIGCKPSMLLRTPFVR